MTELKPCPWCGEESCDNTSVRKGFEDEVMGAESVVRGYWRPTTDGKIICSRCGEYPYKGRHGDTAVNYISKKFRPYRCPNCGAKMYEEEEDDQI